MYEYIRRKKVSCMINESMINDVLFMIYYFLFISIS
jgi:hypothetical protein